jgi:hypothetical protein
LKLATCVLGEQSTKELDIVIFSGNTVRRLIQELSADIKKQLVSLLQSSVSFSLVLDELTIVLVIVVLAVFVRCLFENKTEGD